MSQNYNTSQRFSFQINPKINYNNLQKLDMNATNGFKKKSKMMMGESQD